jgi:hydroxyethylthiazole kinase-like uncharacterized protein yjeF
MLEGADGKRVVVAAGGGNNGGDALVAARFLVQRGARVHLWMWFGQRLSPLTTHHRLTLERMAIPVYDAANDPLPAADLILDGLLGTGVQLPLRPELGQSIHAVNASGIPVLAIDLPSGLDADTGAGQDQCIQARWTVTLGLPKPALVRSPATGRLLLADIGLPVDLFGSLAGAVRQVYAAGDLVQLTELSLNDRPPGESRSGA